MKDTFSSFLVVFVVVRVDEEVVHVNDKPSFLNHISERVRHELLKSGGGVGHAKEHDSGFIESVVGDEGTLPLVTLLDTDIVVSPSYIKLSEDLGIFEFVDEVGDQGKGICISDCVAIEVSVVLTGLEASILFFDKEEGGCWGGLGWADFPRAEVFVHELVCGFLFFDGEGIEFSYLQDKGLVKVYCMIIRSGWGYMVCGFF